MIPGKFFREKLQRDRATEPEVLGLIDNAHSSSAEFLKNEKVRDELRDHNGRRSLLLGGHVRPWPLSSQTASTASPCPLLECPQCVRSPDSLTPRLWALLQVPAPGDDVSRFMRQRDWPGLSGAGNVH